LDGAGGWEGPASGPTLAKSGSCRSTETARQRSWGGSFLHEDLGQLGRGTGGVLGCVDRINLPVLERHLRFLAGEVCKQHLGKLKFLTPRECPNLRNDLSE